MSGIQIFSLSRAREMIDHRSHFFAALHQETSIFKRGKYFSFTLGVKESISHTHIGLFHKREFNSNFRKTIPVFSCGSFSPGSTLAPILIHFMSERKQ